MSKISDLSDGGSLTSTDFLVAVRAGGNVKVQADGAVTGTTGTFSTALGVGTTSPATLFELSASNNGAAANNTLRFTDTDTGTQANQQIGQIEFQSNDSSGDGALVRSYILSASEDTTPSSYISFGTNPGGAGNATVERMRVTGNGKFLVGTTTAHATSSTFAGFTQLSDGASIQKRDDGIVAYFDRLNGDGDIHVFQRDATNIGRIGIKTARPYFSQASGSGIALSSINLLPTDGTGTASDNTNDIGFSSFRFKDLYLGGGVYLGGTGAANKLDDYEETTFTATLVGGTTNPGTQLTATGNIRKVGAVVHFNVGFENVSTTGYSGSIVINGLPFAHKSGSRSIVNIAIYNDGVWSGTEQIVGVISASETRVQFRRLRQGASWQAMVFDTAGSSRYFWASGTYTTAS